MPSDREAITIENDLRSLTCQEVVELITSYLEGALDERERALVADHLAVCANCTIYLDQMRQTAVWLSNMTGNGVRSEVKADLLRRFQQWRSGQRS